MPKPQQAMDPKVAHTILRNAQALAPLTEQQRNEAYAALDCIFKLILDAEKAAADKAAAKKQVNPGEVKGANA